MADDADPPPAGLELAFDWLQRNIDDLAATTRRTQALAGSPVIAGPGSSGQGPDRPTDGRAPASAGAVTLAPRPAVEQASAGRPPAAAAVSPKPTPLLDSIGRDLTALAAEGSLAPVLGREEETEWMIEVLLRTAKRNPVLLGPAGVGKTAIVEGLAQRIAAGLVPEPLRGCRIIEVPLSLITAGTQYRGQLEERMAQLVAEASQPSIILFFDEIHLLAGAGRTEGSMGADQVLKPALARGDLAVIGATTPEEYRATIARDEAFARRFTTVTVPELDRDATRPIMASVRDALARSRGVRVSDAALEVLLDFADREIANRRFPDKAIDLLQQAVARAIVDGRKHVDRDDALATTVSWAKRASSTPTLDRFGRNLVELAKAGKLGPIIGREREIDAIVEVLLRRSKRNPILLGPAGAGKTAIVEGLALRIAAGSVPDALRDVHLFDVPLLALAAGIEAEPDLLGELLLEVRHPSVVVFFDEIHLLVSPRVRDLAESLKPALARGEIACIGATTGEEYQADLESETALARRFTTIAVEPMDRVASHAVLVAVRDSLVKLRGIPVDDDALEELLALADQVLPNRAFPDKGVDVIEQSVAYALTHGLTRVDVATAREAVAAMTGMPLDPTSSLAALAATLDDRAILDPAARRALLARLSVSMHGYDARRERPDGVILLCDGAAAAADPLADAVARLLFGRETARIDIDLGGLTQDHSISSLLGSAPGLVDSERPLALHALRRSPWQVVLLRAIEACSESVRGTIAAALASGTFTDAMGRVIPLGATVVILTAPEIGAGSDTPDAVVLAARLGPALLGTCDVVTGTGAGVDDGGRRAWVVRELLDPLAARLARRGYGTTFDPDFVAWLVARLPRDGTPPDQYLDRSVTPLIVAGLPATAARIAIGVQDDRPVVRATAADDAAQPPA